MPPRASSSLLRSCNLTTRAHLQKSSTISLSSQCLRLSTPSQSTRQRRIQQSRRYQSTDAAAVASTSPKISGIVDQISQLTLLETADLVASLKSRLNIPELSFAAPSAPAPSAPTPAAAAEEPEEAAPAAAEKTLFTLTLKSFEATAKPKIIKEVKSMLGLSLVDSKKFVESAPKVLKESVPKAEAEKIVEVVKGLGGVVEMA